MEDTIPEQQPQAPVPEAPQTEVANPLEILKRNLKTLVVAVVVAAAIIMALTLYRTQQRTAVTRSAEMLGAAASVRNLEDIISQYPKTPAAQLAALGVAKAHFDAGSYDLAATTYAEFEARNSTHPLAPVAALGRVACSEAKGQIPEALRGYAEFQQKHPTSFLTPLAVFGQARCLEATGNLSDAKRIYEDFKAANPESPWLNEVNEALQFIDRKLRLRASARQE